MKKLIKAIMAAIIYSGYIAGFMSSDELVSYDGMYDYYRKNSIEAAKRIYDETA